jgi:hypothetical protein
MPTFTQIGSAVTVGGAGAANIDFTSIPATYTDLVIKISARYDQSSDNAVYIRFNSDSGSNYSYRYLFGSGAAAGSANASTQTLANMGISVASSYTASTFSNSEIYIPNYAGSTQKSMSGDNVQENNATTAFSTLTAGLWTGTAAITSIRLLPASGNFVQHSTAYLYGVSNA